MICSVGHSTFRYIFYEDAYIFAPNLHAMGLMSTRDFENYFTLFNMLSSLIQPPDLVVYLRATVPTLVRQIQKRGRKYEDNIRLDYLKRLNERYEAWIESYKLGKMLIVDVDSYNFIDKPEDLNVVIDKVNASIHGLF
jgi:deoxyadenosine/deoxycytidine kinase